MKLILSFIAGVVVGAVAALMLAPASGDELRAQMRAEAEANAQKAQAEWQKNMDEMHNRMDKMHGDLNTYIAQVRGKGEAEAEPVVEAA